MSTVSTSIHGNTGPLRPPTSSLTERANAGAQQSGMQFSTLLSNFTPPKPSMPPSAQLPPPVPTPVPPPSQTAQQEQAHAQSNGSASKELERNNNARREAQQQEARLTARRGASSGSAGITDRVGRSSQPTPAYTGKEALPGEDSGTVCTAPSDQDSDAAATSAAGLKGKKTAASDTAEQAASVDSGAQIQARPEIEAKTVAPTAEQAGGRPFGSGTQGGQDDTTDRPGRPAGAAEEDGAVLSAHNVRRGGLNASDASAAAAKQAGAQSAAQGAGQGKVDPNGLDADGADKSKAAAALFGQTLQAAGQSQAGASASTASAREGGADFASALNAATAGVNASNNGTAKPEAAPAGSNPVILAQPLHSPAFAPEMAARLSVLAAGGVQEAQLHLNPAEMGPVAVQIVVDGQQAQVSFHAESAETRAVLERGLPDLAAALRDSGLTLSGGGVFQQQMNQPGQSPAQTSQESSRGTRQVDRSALTLDSSVDASGRPPSARSSQGVLDIYA